MGYNAHAVTGAVKEGEIGHGIWKVRGPIWEEGGEKPQAEMWQSSAIAAAAIIEGFSQPGRELPRQVCPIASKSKGRQTKHQ